MAAPISAAGLGAFVLLTLGTLAADKDSRSVQLPSGREGRGATVRLLAVGDINLGRVVGQQILGGDTLFPFALIRGHLEAYDFVFGNLECQLSDQNGETQHPRNNLVFTGPPAGAAALKKGGVTHVSTANNHALDYGSGALHETIENLNQHGVIFSGTGARGEDLFAPALFEVRGTRFALFSCTEIMNMQDRDWTVYVAEADSARLFPRIRDTRNAVDFILLSYHGGAEYADKPSIATRAFAHGALKAGADLFIGHHPHVPQGLEEVDGKLIAYSLGNFVFFQPFAFWTQRSFALEVSIRREGGTTRIKSFRRIPLVASNQPYFLQENKEGRLVLDHVDRLSNAFLMRGNPWPN